jgi:hypothetical protein
MTDHDATTVTGARRQPCDAGAPAGERARRR